MIFSCIVSLKFVFKFDLKKINMKNIVFVLILISAFSTTAQQKKPVSKKPTAISSGSNYKLGYIYEDYILEKYKEVKVLDEQIKKKRAEFQEKYNQMAIDYQTSLLDYQSSMKNLDSMTTEKLNVKLKTVQESKAKTEEFQRNAEKEIQEITGAGVQQIRLNIDKATKEVSAEKKYQLVLLRNKADNSMTYNRTVLYAADGGRDNLSDAVLAKLNTAK